MGVTDTAATTAPGHAAWYALDTPTTTRLLETTEVGLSEDQRARRLARYGRNEVSSRTRTPWWARLLESDPRALPPDPAP